MRTVRWIAVGAATCILLSGPFAGVVAAHTDFDYSTPGDGDWVEAPVDQVLIVFTAEARPADEGFVALDGDGTLRRPDQISSNEALTEWTLLFDPPLAGGSVGVRWTVQAPDTHPISGSFSFTVNASLPTVPPSTSASAAPTTTSATAPAATPTTTAAPTTTTSRSTDEGAENPTLDEFLAAAEAGNGAAGWFGGVGRVASIGGAVLGIGLIAFYQLIVARRPNPLDGRSSASFLDPVVRRSGGLLVVGALVEFAAQAEAGDIQWSTFGTAVGLRLLAGGLFAAVGLRSIPLALAGATAAWVSFAFDGHTVSEGARWLHTIVSLVHVGAASVWGGGLLALALFARRPAPIAALVVRFSVVAAVAVVATALAGSALTLLVLDEVEALWSTAWGQLLLLKTGLVAVAALCGAYNHRVLVPALRADGDHGPVLARLRQVVAIEVTAIVGVLVLTAFLVGSSAQ